MKYLLAWTLLFASPAIMAGNFNHNFVEIGLFKGDIADLIDFEGKELRAGASLGNWLVYGRYEYINFQPLDFFGLARIESTSNTINLGGGRAFPITRQLEFFTGAGFVQASYDTAIVFEGERSTESGSDIGYFVNIALRARLAEGIEAGFSRQVTTVPGDQTYDWRADLRWYLAPGWMSSIGYRDFEGDSAYQVAFRKAF